MGPNEKAKKCLIQGEFVTLTLITTEERRKTRTNYLQSTIEDDIANPRQTAQKFAEAITSEVNKRITTDDKVNLIEKKLLKTSTKTP